jgi:transcription elongation factor GreA
MSGNLTKIMIRWFSMERVTLITAEKKAELEQELIHLKTVVRPAIGDRLQSARALGDLSENAEYQSSREEQGKNEGRIRHIEGILKYAKIIERSGSDKVELGATVVIKKTADGTEKTYIIVSNTEADIMANKISTTSPIGAAMVGKTSGQSFILETPRGDVEYEIVSVS